MKDTHNDTHTEERKRRFTGRIAGMQRSLFMQLMFVLLAFALLALCSGITMTGMLNDKLLRSANNTIRGAASFISQSLLAPEMTLNFVADKIEDMLLQGESFQSIKEYMSRCSSPAFKDDIKLFSYYSVYGYFDVFEKESCDLNAFYDGGGWVPNDGFYPKGRPYYNAAVDAGGSVIISEPYIDADSGTPVIAYARELRDAGGHRLGVICLDVPMDYISRMIAGEHITGGGHGVLLDKDLQLLVHPNEEMIGGYLYDASYDAVKFTHLIIQGSDISLERFTSHDGVKSIFFGKQLDNGWYLGIIVPESEYYRDLYNMIAVICALSMILAAGLIAILVRINTAKEKSERETYETQKQKLILEAKAAKEQEASRHKSRFLANMSHEVRTPMNAIMGIAEIQLQNGDLPPGIETAFGQIYDSGALLLNIINDILDLSKVEAGKMEITAGGYDLLNMISETVQLNRLRYESKIVEFDVEVDENTPLNLRGDEMRIKQILSNLLSNAFKYTDEGHIKLSVCAEVPDDEESGLPQHDVTIIFTVSDTGRGMTQEQVGKLFTEYTRFMSDDERSVSGTGLGLNIIKHLTDLMGGGIAVESEVNKGSVFTVRLPQKRTDLLVCGKRVIGGMHDFHRQSEVLKKNRRIVRESMPGGSVLVVDDVRSNIFVAKGMLIPYGLKIESACSGFEAIEMIKGGSIYDIVFMDHMMPKMNGIETVKILRSMGYTGIIVALTANAMVGQAEVFLDNGFDGYITKPIDSRKLDAVVCEFIRDKDRAS